MGMMFLIYAIPVLSLAFVVWAVASRRLSSGPRRASMVAAILLACGVLTLVRTGGITGDGDADFHWRWTETPEERLLAQASDEPPLLPSARAAADTPAESLVGQSRRRSGTPVVAGRISGSVGRRPRQLRRRRQPIHHSPGESATGPAFADPSATASFAACGSRPTGRQSPPVELWRRPIGPGWSSFAVRGDLLYTQEQRGDDEIVACYNVTTGEPVWRHRDAARFWESNGGAGPRATPTLSNGRVYTLGATGILNALDAGTGAVVWSRNAASDTGAKIPDWGFASSPLVVDDLVIVAASGTLAAYDLATGKPRWVGPTGGGELQLAASGDDRRRRADPAAERDRARPASRRPTARCSGSTRGQAAPIVQPALTADGDVLINAVGMTGGRGMRRLAVAHGAERMDRRRALDVERAEAVLQRLRRSQGPCLRLRRQHPRVHRPRGRQAQVEGRTLRQRPARAAARSGPAAGAVGGRRAGAGQRDARPVHGARAVPGDRGQDLEPPGAGRRRPAGSQRRGDGRVPAVPRGPLTGSFQVIAGAAR